MRIQLTDPITNFQYGPQNLGIAQLTLSGNRFYEEFQQALDPRIELSRTKSSSCDGSTTMSFLNSLPNSKTISFTKARILSILVYPSLSLMGLTGLCRRGNSTRGLFQDPQNIRPIPFSMNSSSQVSQALFSRLAGRPLLPI